MKRSTALLAGAAGLYTGIKLARMLRRMSLQNRVVMITGGTRGLGLAIARECAFEGARLAVMARDEREVRAARRELLQISRDPMTLVCDVTDDEALADAIQKVERKFGRIDVLINNAGQIQVGPLDHMRSEDFDVAHRVHVRAPLNAMLGVRDIMRRQGGGRIVNIASIGGLVAVPHMAPYTASKFGLVGLSDAFRTELYRDHILVTTVCPGLMRTGSHIQARLKGQAHAEYTWFTWSDAMPFLSIDAQRAARAIVNAARDGIPRLDLTLPTRLACIAQALVPGVVANATRVAATLLPEPKRDRSPREIPGRAVETPGEPANLSQAADANNERSPGG